MAPVRLESHGAIWAAKPGTWVLRVADGWLTALGRCGELSLVAHPLSIMSANRFNGVQLPDFSLLGALSFSSQVFTVATEFPGVFHSPSHLLDRLMMFSGVFRAPVLICNLALVFPTGQPVRDCLWESYKYGFDCNGLE